MDRELYDDHMTTTTTMTMTMTTTAFRPELKASCFLSEIAGARGTRAATGADSDRPIRGFRGKVRCPPTAVSGSPGGSGSIGIGTAMTTTTSRTSATSRTSPSSPVNCRLFLVAVARADNRASPDGSLQLVVAAVVLRLSLADANFYESTIICTVHLLFISVDSNSIYFAYFLHLQGALQALLEAGRQRRSSLLPPRPLPNRAAHLLAIGRRQHLVEGQ